MENIYKCMYAYIHRLTRSTMLLYMDKSTETPLYKGKFCVFCVNGLRLSLSFFQHDCVTCAQSQLRQEIIFPMWCGRT